MCRFSMGFRCRLRTGQEINPPTSLPMGLPYQTDPKLLIFCMIAKVNREPSRGPSRVHPPTCPPIFAFTALNSCLRMTVSDWKMVGAHGLEPWTSCV
jgi:hypothetical protein